VILNPAIIALLIGSSLICLMTLYAGFWGIRIIGRWDLSSGSDVQLGLERRTYLISTILNYVFGFQLISFFLYIYTADDIHDLFVGAMCAAGTLNVNDFGYPLLILKIVNFVLAGLWLVVNYADTRAFDYPLVKKKYAFLLFIIPFIFAEAVLLGKYFFNLRADVITSCCGSLFSAANTGVTSEIVSLPPVPVLSAYYGLLAALSLSGAYFLLRGRGGYVFSLLSVGVFAVSVVALISVVSIYVYELPTHHCPFCVLQKEYGYVGYVLYVTLLGGAIAGMAVGLLMPMRGVPSLREHVPGIQKRLAAAALILSLAFCLVVTYEILTSNLRL